MARPGLGLRSPRFLVLASVCVVVAALYAAQVVLIPMALAIFVCFILAPMVERLERLRLHRVLAVALVVSAALAVVVAIGWTVGTQLTELASRLPEYRDNIERKASSVRGPLVRFMGMADRATQEISTTLSQPTTQPAEATTQPTAPSAETAQTAPGQTVPGQAIPGQADSDRDALPPPPNSVAQSDFGTARDSTRAPDNSPSPDDASAPPPTRVEVTKLPEEAGDRPSRWEAVQSIIGPVLSFFGQAGIVLILVVFFLIQREDLRDRIIRVFGPTQINLTTRALDDAASRVSRYLLMLSAVNGSYGLAAAAGLYFIGVPSSALWGLLCAVLRFVPYVGPWVAASMPVALSLAVSESWVMPLLTLSFFVLLELLSNNVMEPMLYGRGTGVSPVAVIVAAIFWTWLWGVAGLLLATPMTVCLVVLGKYVPQMEFVSVLLGDEPPLERHVHYYQRLLASDSGDAEDLIDSELEKLGPERVYQEVIMPALALAEQDRHRGRIEPGKADFVQSAIRESIDDVETWRTENQAVRAARGKIDQDTTRPELATLPRDCRINVLCLPSRDEADELCATMLANCLRWRGYCVEVASSASLAGEMLEHADRFEADLIVISALPPAAMMHARYLCKRLGKRLADRKVLIALWTATESLTRARKRFACVSDSRVTGDLAAAMTEVHQLAQPMVVRRATSKPEQAAAPVN